MIWEFFALYLFFCVFFCLRYWGLAEFSYWYFWKRDAKYTDNTKFQRAPLPAAERYRDLRSAFKSFLVGALAPTIAHSSLLRQYTHLYDAPLGHGLIWLLLSYPIVYHCHDIYYYWTHRLMHHPKLFKAIHREHHRTRDTSPFSGYSMSGVESVIEYFWVFPLLFVMPLNTWMLDIFWLQLLMNNSWGHCGMDFRHIKGFNFPGARFTMQSHDHCYHHQKMSGNYGASLKIWDILMGTDQSPDPLERARVDVEPQSSIEVIHNSHLNLIPGEQG